MDDVNQVHYEVQGLLHGSDEWHRVGRFPWIVESAARNEYTEFTGPLYERYRRTHDVRLARVTTVRKTEVIEP